MRTYRIIPSPTSAPLWSIKIEGDLPSWSPTGTFGKYPHKADARARIRVLITADKLNNIESRFATERSAQ